MAMYILGDFKNLNTDSSFYINSIKNRDFSTIDKIKDDLSIKPFHRVNEDTDVIPHGAFHGLVRTMDNSITKQTDKLGIQSLTISVKMLGTEEALEDNSLSFYGPKLGKKWFSILNPIREDIINKFNNGEIDLCLRNFRECVFKTTKETRFLPKGNKLNLKWTIRTLNFNVNGEDIKYQDIINYIIKKSHDKKHIYIESIYKLTDRLLDIAIKYKPSDELLKYFNADANGYVYIPLGLTIKPSNIINTDIAVNEFAIDLLKRDTDNINKRLCIDVISSIGTLYEVYDDMSYWFKYFNYTNIACGSEPIDEVLDVLSHMITMLESQNESNIEGPDYGKVEKAYKFYDFFI